MTPNVTPDPKLQEFLDLVDCDPDEVLDIPIGRVLTTEELRAECENVDPRARSRSLGEKTVYFGKYKGQKLKDVPRDYLDWALRQKSTSKQFRRFQRDARQYLEGCDTGSYAEPEDPLTKEFLAIVRTS